MSCDRLQSVARETAQGLTVICDKQPVTYRPGQVFAVAGGVPHSKEIGPDGARVLVGRKY